MTIGRTNAGGGGGIDIKSYQVINHTWAGTTIAALKNEVTIALPTPVSDYTKCICLVRGEYPYLLGFTAFGTTYPAQVLNMPFYAYLSDNNTLKLVPSYSEPDTSTGILTSPSETVLSATQRAFTSLVIEVYEIDGAKSIQFAQKIDTHADGYYTGVSGIAGISDYTKTKVFFQGGYILQYNGSGCALVEYKRFAAYMTSNTELTMSMIGARFGAGGGWVPDNRKAAYYILETF